MQPPSVLALKRADVVDFMINSSLCSTRRRYFIEFLYLRVVDGR